MGFTSQYVAKTPDSEGRVDYSQTENSVWNTLLERQMKIIPNRACDAFIEGLHRLQLTSDYIPQLPDLSKILKALTGWQVHPVAALISAREFFGLLANKQFPCATFIRRPEELDYLKEPDIFHEIFGHCPMLTEPVYATFVAEYAKKVLEHPEEDWPLLQRFFWFTVEFGLIKTNKGLRAYGGGILSSKTETVYCLESDIPVRALFEPVTVFRVPYRIDMPQPFYFVIESFETLYNFLLEDLDKLLVRARELGEYPPFFPFTPGDPALHIHAC